jgi:hypothetical protein
MRRRKRLDGIDQVDTQLVRRDLCELRQACGVEVEFDAVDFAVLWATPDRSAFRGAMALNFSSPTSDAGVMARYFFSGNFS